MTLRPEDDNENPDPPRRTRTLVGLLLLLGLLVAVLFVVHELQESARIRPYQLRPHRHNRARALTLAPR